MRANDSIRSRRAQLKIDGDVDFILDVYETKDFVEIKGKRGGDIVMLRVYNNGDVFEK